MKYKTLFLFVIVALVVSGCTWPWDNKKDAENTNTGPQTVNTTTEVGRVYRSEEPITPTTPVEYQGKVAAAWKAYQASAGMTFFGTNVSMTQEVEGVGALYESLLAMTVPKEYTTLHLRMAMAVDRAENLLKIKSSGADVTEAQKEFDAASALYTTELNKNAWLANALK